MYKQSTMLFLDVITPMHAGSGSDLGVIDLPIQREGHTNFPKIEASSLKGSLRETAEQISDSKKEEVVTASGTVEVGAVANAVDYEKTLQLVFGYDNDGLNNDTVEAFKDNKEFAGAASFSDARLLLLPVKSVKGIFAYVTCPYALKRFKDDFLIVNSTEAAQFPQMQSKVDDASALVSSLPAVEVRDKMVILEEFTFKAKEDSFVTEMAKQLADFFGDADIKEKLVVVSDDNFRDFATHSTEVITRIKISSETGTVATGALFNEEYLPAESKMYALIFTTDAFVAKGKTQFDAMKVMNFIKKSLPKHFQIGGNATLGKGLVSSKFLG